MAGMDQEVFPHVRDLTSDHHISCNDSLKEEDAVALEVPAGGVIFFNCNVPHCPKANVTGNPRAAVAYHFVSKDVARDILFRLPKGDTGPFWTTTTEGAVYSTPIMSGLMADKDEVEVKDKKWKKLTLDH